MSFPGLWCLLNKMPCSSVCLMRNQKIRRIKGKKFCCQCPYYVVPQAPQLATQRAEVSPGQHTTSLPFPRVLLCTKRVWASPQKCSLLFPRPLWGLLQQSTVNSLFSSCIRRKSIHQVWQISMSICLNVILSHCPKIQSKMLQELCSFLKCTPASST